MIYTKEPDRWYMHPAAPMFTSDLKHLEVRAHHAHRLGDFCAGLIVGACLLFGIVTFWGWL